MRSAATWLLRLSGVLGALILAGCVEPCVHVTMTPTGKGRLKRVLNVTDPSSADVSSDLGKEIVDNAKGIYGESRKTKAPGITFERTFTAVPTDIKLNGNTNRGHYRVWESPLGVVHYYSEMLPGCTRPLQRLEQGLKMIDSIAAVLSAMAENRLHGEEGLDRLVAFINGPLKEDLRELAFLMHASVVGATLLGRTSDDDRERGLSTLAAYVVQFAADKGYVELEDIPRLIAGNEASQASFVKRLIAKRMRRELDANLSRRLAFVADSDQLAEAWEQAMEASGIDEDILGDQALALFAGAFHLDLFGAPPNARFIINCEAEPVSTSGKWDADKRRVTWAADLRKRNVLAPLLFVLWATPNEAWQKQHLGGVVLQGEALCECLMSDMVLGDEDRAVWREAIEGLDGAGDVVKQLRAFAAKEGTGDGLRECADKLIGALGAKERAAAQPGP